MSCAVVPVDTAFIPRLAKKIYSNQMGVAIRFQIRSVMHCTAVSNVYPKSSLSPADVACIGPVAWSPPVPAFTRRQAELWFSSQECMSADLPALRSANNACLQLDTTFHRETHVQREHFLKF